MTNTPCSTPAELIERVKRDMRDAAIAWREETGKGDWLCVMSDEEREVLARAALQSLTPSSPIEGESGDVEEDHGYGALDVHRWINRAYGVHPRDVSPRFTRFNMVVAYRAGQSTAPVPAAPADSGGEGLRDVAAERLRQVEQEGWTPQHDDDHHAGGSLALAAALYATPEPLYCVTVQEGAVKWIDPWPWQRRVHVRHDLNATVNDGDNRLKHDRRRQLVIAGALILAEIERIDRAARRAGS